MHRRILNISSPRQTSNTTAFGRLMEFLTALRQDVEITVGPTRRVRALRAVAIAQALARRRLVYPESRGGARRK